jgi:hypothetical protein
VLFCGELRQLKKSPKGLCIAAQKITAIGKSPKGLCIAAQGCRLKAATLGGDVAKSVNPERVP